MAQASAHGKLTLVVGTRTLPNGKVGAGYRAVAADGTIVATGTKARVAYLVKQSCKAAREAAA